MDIHLTIIIGIIICYFIFYLFKLICFVYLHLLSLKLDPKCMAALYQLLQVLAHNIMVQKYGVCIEVVSR